MHIHWRACAVWVTLCVVCLSVCHFLWLCAAWHKNSDTNRLIARLASFKKGHFGITTAFRVMAWKSICKLALALALCILNAHEVTTKDVYRLPHAIYRFSYPVADSLLGKSYSPAHHLAHAQLAEGLAFSEMLDAHTHKTFRLQTGS